MMKHTCFVFLNLFLALFFFCSTLCAQDVSLALQKKPDISPMALTAAWAKQAAGLQASFATSNRRFAAELPPDINTSQRWQVSAWRGEKVHTQVLLWTKQPAGPVTLQVSDLKNGQGYTIKKDQVKAGLIRYVMTDEFRGGCGYRKPADFDSSYVADRIDTATRIAGMSAQSTQPVWVSIKVPANAVAGVYTGTLTVSGPKKQVLAISLQVSARVLPPPAEWQYNLDLWQHPAAVARVHQLPLWSDAHFAAMKGYYTMLASAGQKAITASIVNEPWGHQTYDDYPSLIKWTKKKDGTWKYDYSLFDRYIAFVMSCGIKGRINCYSMVPWKVAFTYYNEATQKEEVFTGGIGTPEYNAFWTPMLEDFTRHLKAKKWFDMTYIAMDERPMKAMQSVIALLKIIDKDWKIALAGDYHPEIEEDIFDYCVASRWTFPDEVLQKRKAQGKISTWYTCCTEKYPNGFTFSPPAEHTWMGWYTAATRMDGYLRWAYNSWTKNPLTDSRFTAWPAGDTYQVYPGPFSSIRFEKLIEGVQDFEKIRLLRAEYAKAGNTAGMIALEEALKTFRIPSLALYSAEDMIDKAKILLNE